MAKSSGLGAQLYFGGYDLSGDVGSVGRIESATALLDATAIDKSAMERMAGLNDGGIDFDAFFNDATGAAHPVLKVMGSSDKSAMFLKGTTLGDVGAGVIGKQVDYAGTRGNDGSLAFNVSVESSNGDGLRWGRSLTAGKRVDTAATNGSSIDDGAATAAGAVIFLQVFAFSGTDVTIKVQDSANNTDWTDLSGAAFTSVTSAPTTQRLSLGTTADVRRYLRAVTTTTGGVTSVTFSVLLCRR